MADDPTTSGGCLVDAAIADGIAWITLNDPARRNCVSARMSLDLAAVCEELADDPAVRVAVITGAGPAFSSGGDIESLTRPGRHPLEVLYRGFSAVASLPVPVLAAVNGPAVGAGMNFALACDVIVAGSSARFDPRFLDVGIHPGGGHLWRLQQLAGHQAAAAMVIFGESLTAGQAERLGLVWRVVADDELAGAARELPAGWRPNPPSSCAGPRRRWPRAQALPISGRRSTSSSSPRSGRCAAPRSRRASPPYGKDWAGPPADARERRAHCPAAWRSRAVRPGSRARVAVGQLTPEQLADVGTRQALDPGEPAGTL